jgi:hypothetical protein
MQEPICKILPRLVGAAATVLPSSCARENMSKARVLSRARPFRRITPDGNVTRLGRQAIKAQAPQSAGNLRAGSSADRLSQFLPSTCPAPLG